MHPKEAFKCEKTHKKIKETQKNRKNQSLFMLSGFNIYYGIDNHHNWISCGGIGIIHQIVQQMGPSAEINNKFELFKCHTPYHESDHILNIAYDILSGGACLEDIELPRRIDWLTSMRRALKSSLIWPRQEIISCAFDQKNITLINELNLFIIFILYQNVLKNSALWAESENVWVTCKIPIN